MRSTSRSIPTSAARSVRSSSQSISNSAKVRGATDGATHPETALLVSPCQGIVT
jgi:hypothetical protein